MILYDGDEGLILMDDQGIEIRNLSKLGLECEYCAHDRLECGNFFISHGKMCDEFILDT